MSPTSPTSPPVTTNGGQTHNNKLAKHVHTFLTTRFPNTAIDSLTISDTTGIILSHTTLSSPSSTTQSITPSLRTLLHQTEATLQQVGKLDVGDYTSLQLSYTDNLTLYQYHMSPLIATYIVPTQQCNIALLGEISGMLAESLQPLRMQIQIANDKQEKEQASSPMTM